ncbi:MAG: preprotein translocase subunit SecG [Planctomycetia bacterium]|nr:preprotein translocase subunit SecG [Planctomycetia bacterium]
MAGFLHFVLFTCMILLSFFMILIILIQRGKGGGLVGAFGGMGGQSAFGTKSSDVFVKITVITAIIWFVLCVGGRHILSLSTEDAAPVSGRRTAQAPVNPTPNAIAPVKNADQNAPAAAPAASTPAPAPAAAPAPAPATSAPAAPAASAPAPAAPAPASPAK